MNDLGPLTVGAAARALDIPASQLRRWDNAGLLTLQRSRSGYRIFTPQALEQARRLQADLSLQGNRLHAHAKMSSTLDLPDPPDWQFETCANCRGGTFQLMLQQIAEYAANLSSVSWAFCVHRHLDGHLCYSSLAGAVRLDEKWFKGTHLHMWNRILSRNRLKIVPGPQFDLESGRVAKPHVLTFTVADIEASIVVGGASPVAAVRLERLVENLVEVRRLDHDPDRPNVSNEAPPTLDSGGRFRALARLNHTIVHSNDLALISAEALDAALETTNTTLGAVAFTSPRMMFDVRTHRGLTDRFVIHLNATKTSTGLMGKALGLREALVIDDLTKHHSVTFDVVSGENVRAFLVMPLALGLKAFGLLVLYSRQVGVFGDSDVQLLEPIAAALAQAVERDQLRKRLEAETVEREKVLLDWSKQAQRELHRARGTLFQEVRRRLQNVEDSNVEDLKAWMANAERVSGPTFDIGVAITNYVVPRLRETYQVEVDVDIDAAFAEVVPELAGRLFNLVELLLEEAGSAASRNVAMSATREEGCIVLNLADDRPQEGPGSLPSKIEAAVAETKGTLNEVRHLGFSSGIRVSIPLLGEESGYSSLTLRERSIADQLAEGLGNREIASRLNISPKTLQNHLTAIYRKLGVTTKGGAISRLLH